MKAKLLLTLIMASFSSMAQTPRNYKTTYIKSITNSVFGDDVYGLDTTIFSIQLDTTKKVSKSEKKYNGYMLNSLFTSLLNEKAFNSSDLSTSRYYATVTNEDNEFSFGMNFNTSKSNLIKRNWVGSLGFNLKSKSGFATVFKNGTIQNNIYITGKIGHIGNGVITFTDSDKTSYNNYYKNYLRDTYRGKLEKTLKADGTIDEELEKLRAANKETAESFDKELTKTKRDLVSKLAEEEMEALEEYRWYSRIRDFIWSAEVKLPVSTNIFKTSISNDSAMVVKENQYLWNASAQGTFVWKYRNKSKLFLTGKGKFENSNNALTEELKTSNFLTFVSQSTNNLAVSETNEVYIGEFNRFVVGSVGAEAIFFYKTLPIGLSASIEQTFIGTEFTNWKLGIPIKLRDKDGKGANLELQYKELNKVSFVGFRAGFVLGKFVR